MISQLFGKIISLDEKFLVIDVNGIGYKVFCSTRSLQVFKESKEITSILTELIVREDSLTLYGFSDKIERTWFNLLQSVQGVGSKASLAILSSISINDLISAILSSDKILITRAEGIGNKIAGRILNELKDKIPDVDNAPLFSGSSENNNKSSLSEDAISALVNLGYNRNEAHKMVIMVIAKSSSKINLSNLISMSLKELIK